MVKNKMNIKPCLYVMLLILSCVFVSTPVLAATVIAAVDRNPVKVDESFRLVLTIKGGTDGEPVLDVLKKDFDILGRSQSSNFQIINGNMSRQTRFVITLMAKRVGKLTIPPIRVGSDSSQGIIMTVLKSTASHQKNTDVSLEVTVNTKNVTIQEQLIVTVRLYRSVNLANASLSTPQVSGGEAIIEKLGDDSEFETQRNGVSLKVIERHYVIFPQQSGVLMIEPVLFNGQIVQAASRFSNNPLFQNVRNKRLRSEPLTINVSAIPAAHSSDRTNKPWLPARHITLTEVWPETPPVFKAGEAITRTLTLVADGLMAAQLPDIIISMPAGFKHYSDQAVMNDQHKGAGIIGSRQQKIAIIPAKEGLYTLPEIKLEWWNTKTHRSETLRLPQRRIQVLPADASSAPLEQDPAVANASRQESGKTALAFESGPLGLLVQARFWPWLSLALLVGWLSTVLVIRAQKRTLLTTLDQELHQSSEVTFSKKTAIKRIKKACLSNDPVETKEALLVWAKLHFSENTFTSLADIANGSNDVVSAEVRLLNQALYSQMSSAWSGQGLWQAIDLYNKDNERSKTNNKGKKIFAPLYP